MVIVVVAVLSHVQLFCDPTTVALQALPSMEFLRQEYWSGLPFSTRESFISRDRTCVSCVFCTSRWIL